MALTRRRLLAAGATGGLGALALVPDGCSEGLPLVGTSMPRDGTIATSAVETVPGDASVVAFADLSDAERALLRTAVNEGLARACLHGNDPRGDALGTFANRLDGPTTYLAFEGDYYGLWVRSTDVVAADTADPPSGDANPCCRLQ